MIAGPNRAAGTCGSSTRLVERCPEHTDERDPVVKPFTSATGFTDDWWVDFNWDTSVRWFSLIDDTTGDELVRVEVVPTSEVGALYRTVPANGYTEIELIEVHGEHRRQGWGRTAIEKLQEQLPGPYAALAKDGAEPFWTGLGWTAFQHPGDPEHCDVLFIDEPGQMP
ncbi:hypothetical protein GCM10009584_14400 [Ornithinimicrobium humiphilum]|uniref:N-acetyltransferase domain-containing protein n=1 Tax=Ornithinimicrobium humiphilum TaxID=125288 RepID=A0A543KKC3_9MICO|nr:GNAT family N-acetyltransferase [Ornithinimicrobium humiphilum]TQM95533.1 hypothetical protein FB476_0377 [Ornithinimicrobium humiphilum]